MAFQSYKILVVSLFCLYSCQIIAAGGPGDACMEKLNIEDKKATMTVMETCKKKLNLDELPKHEDVEKNGFDDKCFAKCKLTEMKIINDQGALDIKAFEELMKKAAPEKQADLVSLWQNCYESTKKTIDGEGGLNEKTVCKAAAMLKHCFMQGVQKLC